MPSNLNLYGLGSLRLYELTANEKRALLQVLEAAIESGMFSRRELERTCKVGQLRYIVSSTESPRHGRKTKVSVRYDKWVRLYNYVMTDVLKEAQQRREERVLSKVRTLHRLGIDSQRYDSDNNVFMQKFLSLDAVLATVDPGYSNGCYLVFRQASDKKCLRVGMVQIRSVSDRYVFESKLAHKDDPHRDRHSSGAVYQLRTGHLTLVGFLNNGQGLETYTLKPAEKTLDILHGIMTTSGYKNEPHSKQCCFIRAGRYEGRRLSEAIFAMPRAWEIARPDLLELEDWPLDKPIRLENPYGRVFLSQYINDEILHFCDDPSKVKDTESGPPY